jgi:hypothetical protein
MVTTVKRIFVIVKVLIMLAVLLGKLLALERQTQRAIDYQKRSSCPLLSQKQSVLKSFFTRSRLRQSFRRCSSSFDVTSQRGKQDAKTPRNSFRFYRSPLTDDRSLGLTLRLCGKSQIKEQRTKYEEKLYALCPLTGSTQNPIEI